jgi:hypothetical protein
MSLNCCLRRSWSNGTLADARFLEYEARDQITLWGPAPRAPWQLDRYARCVFALLSLLS